MNTFILINTLSFGEVLLGIAHIIDVYIDNEGTVIISCTGSRSYRVTESFDEIIERWTIANRPIEYPG